MACTTKSLYDSVEACPGQKMLAGIRRRLYYIPKAHIASWPVLPSVDTENATMETIARYTGDFTLDGDKVWKFIDLKDEASNVTFESAGEDGSKLFNNQANAIVSGMRDAVKGFAREANNDDIVFLYQNRDGSFCVLGNEMFKTHVTPSGDTGSEVTGAITTTFAIQVYDDCPVPTYTGLIKISSTSSINAATGLEVTQGS